jgi:hypothetical protein
MSTYIRHKNRKSIPTLILSRAMAGSYFRIVNRRAVLMRAGNEMIRDSLADLLGRGSCRPVAKEIVLSYEGCANASSSDPVTTSFERTFTLIAPLILG